MLEPHRVPSVAIGRGAALAILILLLAPAALGCIHVDGSPRIRGNGVYLSDDRSGWVEHFEGISLDSSADVLVTVEPGAAAPSVIVRADENILPYIVTEVRSGRLHIRSRRNFSSRNPVEVEIVTPSLSSVRLRGSGDMTVRNIDADSFTAGISGSGDLALAGRARDASYFVSGSGAIRATDLEAQTADASITGSGNVSLRALQDAALSISGSGHIHCYGAPNRVRRSVTGSGRIRVD